jgi:hypothetical protein
LKLAFKGWPETIQVFDGRTVHKPETVQAYWAEGPVTRHSSYPVCDGIYIEHTKAHLRIRQIIRAHCVGLFIARFGIELVVKKNLRERTESSVRMLSGRNATHSGCSSVSRCNLGKQFPLRIPSNCPKPAVREPGLVPIEVVRMASARLQ